jgi:pilus assembly protein CpaE
MAQLATKLDVVSAPESPLGSGLSRIPQITIDVFCQTPATREAVDRTVADRRMARARCNVHAGGPPEAIGCYQRARSPNLIIVETHSELAELHRELDSLAEVCDPATKVIIIGRINDVSLYRDLLDRGVSEYLLAPLDALTLIRSVARLYRQEGSRKLGRTVAFVGAKGGVGSSVIAHNVATGLGRLFSSEVILADLDLPFGNAGLAFNLEPAQGIEEAVKGDDRVDDVLLERLVAKHGEYLNVLPAPAALNFSHAVPDDAFERLLDVAQATVPFVVLDVPHVWAGWTKRCLVSADEVVVTATPDLTSLRNAKNLVELLKQARPNDAAPKLVLNQVGIPKRTEISASKFASVLKIEPVVCIPFEPAGFSAAETAGKTIAERSSRTLASARIDDLARLVSGRLQAQAKKSALSFTRLWRK